MQHTPAQSSDENLVVQLCAEGMAVGGDPVAAHGLFLRAWEARRDDYDASIAAHFLARHQPSPAATLHWNRVAIAHAQAVADDRAKSFLASLYLNLADSYLALGASADASVAAEEGLAALDHLPVGGYREFVAHGLHRLQARLAEGKRPGTDI